jgi:tetratricopeptide (TPR) repeat protein
MNEKTCSKCGRKFPEYFSACPYCGQQADVKKKKGSPVKVIAIVLVIVLVLGAAGFGIWKAVDYTTRKGYYDQGTALMLEGRFVEAIEAFEAAGDFEDAADRIAVATLAEYHRQGIEAFDKGDYAAAIDLFTSAAGYSDADARKLEAQKGLHYVNGKAAMDAEDAETAIEELTLAGDFPGAAVLLKDAKDLQTYQTGLRLMDAGNYAEALTTLNTVSNWPGAAAEIRVCNYHLGKAAMDAGDYSEAMILFSDAGDHSDAKTLWAQCSIFRGKELLAEGKFSNALNCFTNASSQGSALEPDYDSYILLCQAEVAFAEGRLTQGLDYFDKIPQTFKPAEFNIAARRSMKSRIQAFAKLEGTWTSTKYDVKISSVDGGWIYTKYYPEGSLKDQVMTVDCTMNPNGTFNVTVSAKYYYFNGYPYVSWGYVDKSRTITFTLENLTYAPSTHKYDKETTVTFYGTPKLQYQAYVDGDTAISNVTYDQHKGK